jgi:hypothetical protein
MNELDRRGLNGFDEARKIRGNLGVPFPLDERGFRANQGELELEIRTFAPHASDHGASGARARTDLREARRLLQASDEPVAFHGRDLVQARGELAHADELHVSGFGELRDGDFREVLRKLGIFGRHHENRDPFATERDSRDRLREKEDEEADAPSLH